MTIELTESEIDTIFIAFEQFQKTLAHAWNIPFFDKSEGKMHMNNMVNIESKILKPTKEDKEKENDN